ncbi:hypothetical protein R4P65_31420 [Rhodococcus sp. IEGM 1318]|nr:hypothetical protein [Rhodococcus sp. IEGM 1318]MDV8009356.1 hypothetical protein [Rhodococcus sp. IEGM 1318]
MSSPGKGPLPLSGSSLIGLPRRMSLGSANSISEVVVGGAAAFARAVAMSSAWASAQSWRARTTGHGVLPSAVRRYSAHRGASAKTSRATSSVRLEGRAACG